MSPTNIWQLTAPGAESASQAQIPPENAEGDVHPFTLCFLPASSLLVKACGGYGGAGTCIRAIARAILDSEFRCDNLSATGRTQLARALIKLSIYARISEIQDNGGIW